MVNKIKYAIIIYATIIASLIHESFTNVGSSRKAEFQQFAELC